jgi:hypothetical protein
MGQGASDIHLRASDIIERNEENKTKAQFTIKSIFTPRPSSLMKADPNSSKG